jgi:hypothetical protein
MKFNLDQVVAESVAYFKKRKDEGKAIGKTESKLFARRAFDVAYALAIEGRKAQVNPRLGVFAMAMGGFGDILFGIKACKLLRAHFVQATVTLVVEENYVAGAKAFLGAHANVDVKSIKDFNTVCGNADTRPHFVIVGPWVLDHAKDPSPVFQKENSPIKRLWASEYNYSTKLISQQGLQGDAFLLRYHSTGLEAFESGMFVDADLSAYRTTADRRTRAARLLILNQLSDNAGATMLKQLLLDNKPAAQYAPRLYFAYVHQKASVDTFLATTVLFEMLKTKNTDVDIVLGAGTDVAKNNAGALDEKWLKAVEDLPFDRYERWIIEKPTPNGALTKKLDKSYSKLNVGGPRGVVFSSSQPEKCRLRVICCRVGLPNPDILRLLMASEDFTFSTGDQSLSEAIAAGKVIGYEADKQDVLSCMVRRAIALDKKSVAKVMLILANEETVTEKFKATLGLGDLLAKSRDDQLMYVANTMQNASFIDANRAVWNDVCTEQDLRPGLIGLATRGMLLAKGEAEDVEALELAFLAKIQAGTLDGLGDALRDVHAAAAAAVQNLNFG